MNTALPMSPEPISPIPILRILPFRKEIECVATRSVVWETADGLIICLGGLAPPHKSSDFIYNTQIYCIHKAPYFIVFYDEILHFIY